MDTIELNKVEPILSELFHKSIVDSVKLTVKKCLKLGTTPQEPDFVASLTLNFTVDFFNILKAVFPTNKFSVTGVYCHQKPIVNIGTIKNPELGDLLLVYTYQDIHLDKKFNSILFQAKITSKPKITVASSDEHQLKLYCEWPEFTYLRAGILNGTKRSIQPKTLNDGGQYMLIDNHPIRGLTGLPGTFPIGCSSPGKTLSLNNDFATELVDFLKFKSGRPFEANPALSGDDWTKMIWDLLKITKDKASKRKNIGNGNFDRQTTRDLDGYCSFLTESDSIFTDLHSSLRESQDTIQADFVDDNNSGLSVILIENIEQG
jgi:hypothetical protein